MKGTAVWITKDLVRVTDTFKGGRRTIRGIFFHLAQIGRPDLLITGIRRYTKNLSRIFV